MSVYSANGFSSYGFTVYLEQGENTVTLACDDDYLVGLSALQELHFSRVSEAVEAVNVCEEVKANGYSKSTSHSLTVSQDGFYTLGALVNFSVPDNDVIGMTVTFSRKGYVDKVITIDIADIELALENSGREYSGSTLTSYYTALSVLDLSAGDYTVSVNLYSSVGGRYINYQGIVLTELAMR